LTGPIRGPRVVGIRREDKSPWETRTPLVPADVARIVRAGVPVHVQRSGRRCFPDAEFAAAGADLVEDLRLAEVVLAVKEIPAALLERGKTYLFFSHTIKGQPHNMPMLRRLLELGCTLLDYELVTNEHGGRTIAFGRHAGLAGAIDTLWALGRRLAAEGVETPFARVGQALEYGELATAQDAIDDVAREIREQGLPERLRPLAIGVTGAGGRVSGGALEIFDRLPSARVAPEDLAGWTGERIAVVSYGPEHLVEPIAEDETYDWRDYLARPAAYRSRFGPHLARLTALLHGIFWKQGFPRFILRSDLAALWRSGATPRLRVITDVTCDVGGSNESLVRVTDPGDPAYVYDPSTGGAVEGWTGRGPVVLPVDIFPAELPREASRHFSEVLLPLVPALAAGSDTPELARATLVRGGALVPPWDRVLAVPLREHAGS
jgi:alpha-aminoadipic semialdehyde synthase